MTPDERKKAIEEMANDIVNNMSLSEVMAIVVERARQKAEQKIDKIVIYRYPPEPTKPPKPSLWQRIKKHFKKKQAHKGFATKK